MKKSCAVSDPYIKNYLFPEPKDLFDCTLKPISEIKKDCLFVVDTNALLVPYTVGNKSLTQIGKIYSELTKADRFFIPGQVAREFVNRRPDKIKQIHEVLKLKQNKTNDVFSSKTNYPLLEPLQGQAELLALEKQISQSIAEYNKLLTGVIKQVKEWTWNDPVSLMYKDAFKKDAIIDIEISDAIKADFNKRNEHKISPGYKDGGKEDKGIGDYLIWKTILHLGKEKRRDIIFISGEEKPDWWYRSQKERLYPRFELIHEFSRECSNSFHIIKLSELLEMFDVEAEIVEEVMKEEKPTETLVQDTSSFTGPENTESPYQGGA